MAEFHAITSVVTFITKYVTKVTNFVTIHIKCVINRTSVTFGETGGVFKKKFKKSSKVQKGWSGIFSPVTQYGSL